MLRNNALRLRHCSSSVSCRNGAHIRRHSSEKSSVITENEFESALGDVLPCVWNSPNKTLLGLAISGGVDSMGLAALYNRAQRGDPSLPRAYGLIVDHKVRSESTEEAEWVREQLRNQFDMQASILTLTWPEDPDILDMNRFETSARTLRYQALGRACRDKKISAMMVAHHGDDQAETVMMRLARNRLRTGLMAIKRVGWIPECEGIYGVHHSGRLQHPESSLSIPFPIEQGGIQILRPLLSFEKARLIATCRQLGVRWAEDKSNQVPTLTSRNAIRHIYQNHMVPDALSIKSLVNTSMRMTQRVQSHKAYVDQLFDQCLMKLDIQTGSLLVRFPPFSELLGRPIDTESEKHEAWNNAYYLMERITTFVSPIFMPMNHSQLPNKVINIYPEFLSMGEEAELNTLRPKNSDSNFTVNGVWWQKWEALSPFDDLWPPNTIPDDTAPKSKDWLLFRQNLVRGVAKQPKMQVTFLPLRGLPLQSNTSVDPRNTFQLIDGRFWIKLLNHTQDDLVVRIFQEEDMRHLPKMQFEHIRVHDRNGKVIPGRTMTTALHLLKPTALRFTIPAVFRVHKETGEESLVGFPTLNISMLGFGAPSHICDWFVRYKKIELGKRAPGEVVVPGLTKTDYAGDRPWWLKAKETQKIGRRKRRGGPSGQQREIREM